MKIFVSYKRDHKESEALLLLMENSLAKVYSDRLLPLGGEWRPKLLKWIDRCDLFLVLVSEQAVASDEVGEEVRRAYDKWIVARKRPVIIPVRVNYFGPVDRFRRPLSTIHEFSWKGEADNERLLTKLRAEIEEWKRPRRYWAIAALLLLALLVYFFVVAPLGNIRKLRSVSKVSSLSEAKKVRDAASRVGWSSRADAAYAQYLGRWSDGHLANARKSVNQGRVAEGLVLAALVAHENGGRLDGSFLRDYNEGHYASLVQTLRTGATLGAGLAVSSDGTQVAAGNALWNLPARTRCSLGTDAINVVAFGPRGLYTGGNEHVLAWTVCRPGTQFPVREEVDDLEDRVQSLAIAPDDAIAFVMRKGSSVLLHRGAAAPQALKHPEPVRSIAFSRDGSLLVTTSGETLNVWNPSDARPVPKRVKTGLSLRGASLKGDYIAVASPRKVGVWRFRPTAQLQYEIPSDVPVRAVALSDEPNLLAIVTDAGVLVERVAKDAFRLGGTQSVASDVVFSNGNQLVVKRVDAVEIWNPDTSATDAAPPQNRLEDWSRKFALTVDENGRIEPILFKEAR